MPTYYPTMRITPLPTTLVALILLTAGCKNDNAANPPPTTVTGRDPVMPQRRLVCRLRDLATGGESKSTSQDGIDVVQLGSNTTTTANVGDLLRVELQMSSGTGFEWKVAGDTANASPDPILVPKFGWKDGTGTIVPVNAQQPGGSVLCVFEFDVAQAGSRVLTFTLARSWETGVAPSDKRVLTVIVAKPSGS